VLSGRVKADTLDTDLDGVTNHGARLALEVVGVGGRRLEEQESQEKGNSVVDSA
jgi:hypothetical protein